MGATIKCHKKSIGGIVYDSEKKEYRIDDDKIEVTSVVPVIEIPQLCVNDRYKNKVKSWKVNYNGSVYSVGHFVFYKHIVPIVLDVAEKVGFQYLILFCADNETGDLEKYYKTIGFERMDNMACLRDNYSKDLECLIIKIDDLIFRYLKFENPDYHIPNPKVLKYKGWTFFCKFNPAKGMYAMNIIGQTVTVTVDRPLGSFHPQHRDMYYPVNYGYVRGITAPDGEEQDAYILGVNEPVDEFTGKIIAVIHRYDDVEEKWVVAPEGMSFTEEDIRDAVYFQEKYFKSEIRMLEW